jgi:cysteinyl-tRNA synthetase
MSIRHLGETFDIHGGGMDLIFPHHENEIAQSCGATGKEFARYWIHNGFVRINQEKMSKSLGNFFTIREIFEKAQPWSQEETGEVLRYFLLGTHYRSPLDFSDHGLSEARNALDGFYDLFGRLRESTQDSGTGDEQLRGVLEQTHSAFTRAMDDDFNTPAAIAVFQSLRGETNKLLKQGISRRISQQTLEVFESLGQVLGLFAVKGWRFQVSRTLTALVEARHGGSSGGPPLSDEEIARQVDERNEARARKDFKRADEIRKSLASQGIIIEDKPDGTSRWKR